MDIYTADNYVYSNVIDSEDWVDSDDERKQRLLNVAFRELSNKYSNYTIPDDAVYEFGAFLATIFNDTYKMQQYGVKQFTVQGTSFTFSGMPSLDKLIPQTVIDLIGKENGVNLTTRKVGRSVR